VVPYLALGLGRSDIDHDRIQDSDETIADLGGGVKLFITDTIALRGDIRHIQSLDSSDRNLVVNFGLMFQFPFRRSPAVTETSTPAPAPLPPPSPAPAPAPVAPVSAEPPRATAPEPTPDIIAIDLKILFDFDKAIVKPDYYGLLDDLAQVLDNHRDTVLIIQGHTCDIGSGVYNQKLSMKRSQSVKEHLVRQNGVDPNRIIVQGFGETRPETDNRTPENKRLNRRAIIVNMVR
jgi:OOP family OmpA-OmpF porin